MARNKPWLAAGLAALALAASASTAQADALKPTKRYGHTTTYLPNRTMLMAGGIDDAGAAGHITNDVFLILDNQAGILRGPDMSVARASHTATLLPNGEVLVAGGFSAAGTALLTAEIYSPAYNCWRPTFSLGETRGNHTATLLKDGSVLICGGTDGPGSADLRKTCRIFTPVNPAPTDNCAASYGFVLPGPTLLQGRANHTASLLANGRIFFAGGFNKDAAPTWLNTTEVFVPDQTAAHGHFISGHPLGQARAFHTATTLGDGKVFLVGGFNGRNTQESLGLLESTEIYDPISDTVVYAKTMDMRRLGHSAVLSGDGGVYVMGGLGNITTTYIASVSEPLQADSVVNGLGVGQIVKMATNVVQGGTLGINLEFPLSKPVNGHIVDGDIFFSSPGIKTSWGEIWFTPGDPATRTGLHVSLEGTSVYCQGATCGFAGRPFTITPEAGMGSMLFKDFATDVSFNYPTTAGQVTWAGDITEDDPPTTITGGQLVATLTMQGLPAAWVGNTVARGYFYLNSGNIHTTYDETYAEDPRVAITLTGGTADLSGQTVAAAADGSGTISFLATITNLAGEVAASTPSAQSSPASSDDGIADPPHVWPNINNLSGTAQIVMNSVKVGNADFQTGVATVVIRSMIFSDVAKYYPTHPEPDQANSWEYTHRIEGIYSRASYNGTAMLTPAGDIVSLGGRGCYGLDSYTCAVGALERALAVIPAPSAWSEMGSPALQSKRGNHTATTLPDGRLLVAGGTNGTNILATSEVLDLRAGTGQPTGSMHAVRSLHTASLMANGRVLVAGGYSTNSESSGSIRGAEIYYPDTGLWIPTAPMISSRSLHAAVVDAAGNVMAIGGYAEGQYLDQVDIYYSTAGAWRAAAPLNQGRAVHTATLLKDGRVLVAGGQSASGVLASVEIYDPVTGAWSPAAALPAGLHSHTATLLSNGTVLVAGGNDSFGEVGDSYIYDPADDAAGWAATIAPLSVPRHNHTATLLPNGKVLVAGGAQAIAQMGDPIRYVEVYDPMGSTWTLAGDLSRARAYHTVTLASDGALYIVG
ncbi:MAG: kelch repeat-containing protein, partial [Elusimicrobia bacterium]|nr:kelch repeat-containing protein [Elusimicrobiota bacterium]